MAAGSPMCMGEPCTAGNRVVTCTALITFSVGMGRIETTIGPENALGARGLDIGDEHRDG